jgi:hypothetical protein
MFADGGTKKISFRPSARFFSVGINANSPTGSPPALSSWSRLFCSAKHRYRPVNPGFSPMIINVSSELARPDPNSQFISLTDSQK